MVSPAGLLQIESKTSNLSLDSPTSTDILSLITPMLPNPSLTLQRRTHPGTGPSLAKPLLTPSNPCSCQNQSFTSLTLPHPSPSPPTPQSTLPAPSFSKPTRTVNGIPAPTFPNHSPRQNETMTSMTGNSLPSFVR